MTDWKQRCKDHGIDYCDFEERASKREYCAGFSRAKAEMLAFFDIKKELTEKSILIRKVDDEQES